MLTKSDLKAIGTLIRITIKEVSVTKEEAKHFAMKNDLKHFATKDDLKGFASKKDLVGLARGVEIVDLKNTFIDKLSQWKDELFTKIDNYMKEVKATREEQTIISGYKEQIEDHETRIEKVEKVLEIPQN